MFPYLLATIELHVMRTEKDVVELGLQECILYHVCWSVPLSFNAEKTFF